MSDITKYNVNKNPDIDNLEKDSIVKKLYDELYQQFYEAQIPKAPDFPYGIEKGDQTDIRLMNTAYGFAKTVGDSIVVGAEGGKVDVTDFLKKSGDDMLGKLRAIRGFEAGENGRTIMLTNTGDDGVSYVDIQTYLSLPGSGLLIGGKNILSRDNESKATVISDNSVTIDGNKLSLPLNTNIGKFQFSENGLASDDIAFWHSKNSNLPTVNWEGKDIVAHNVLQGNKLHIKDSSLFEGNVDVIINKKDIFHISDEQITANVPLYVKDRIFVNGIRSIRSTNGEIIYEAQGADMIIGSADTKAIKLATDLHTWNKDSVIISSAGYGNFTMGFQASHNKSKSIIKTYLKENKESGIIINDTIRFLDEKGVYLSHNPDKVGMEIGVKNGKLVFYGDKSTSAYKPLNRDSYSVFVDNNSDFIVFNSPVESDSFTVNGKVTQLSDQLLKINKGHMIEGTENYMAYYGNMVIKNNITTDNFSTGFAGSGWGIINNPVTGMTGITIDEATIRRKMRVYELEVQSILATNGSLWVSDSMSGDDVTQII